VDVKEDGQGCMSTIMVPGLDNTPQLLEKGNKLTMEFTPVKTGEYKITCAMGVPRGIIKVQ
jgi:plastocyanin domain-containing protein